MPKFGRTDVAELIIGASVLAFPVAVTEEVWNLSAQIPTLNVFLIAIVSCIFLAIFIYYIHTESNPGSPRKIAITRIIATYGITLLVCAGILLLVGKLPLLSETGIALKRIILVAFPASFSATVVDSLK